MLPTKMTEIHGYGDLVEIGRGGFAVVYRARQISVGRDVAIKLLTDPSPDDDLVRRFQRESRAVGALSWHPHIAAVVDAGSTKLGQAYIVFELLTGGSLDEIVDEAPMPWQKAVASMIQVSDAVEAAHRADVLHRDIKPANILLDRLGVAKLGDFGIASMQDGTKTETGMLATTVSHAAPELFDGKPATAATDVYALGSTLHTLVTGAAPFAPAGGERIATTIAQIISTPPPRPDPALVPTQIANVIAHALAKQPQYRPRTAGSFGRALQQAQKDLGVRVTHMPIVDKDPEHPQEPTPTPHPVAQTITRPVSETKPAASESTPSAPAPKAVAVASVDDEPATKSTTAKPFARLIPILGAIAVLLAVSVGALLLFELQREPAIFTTTEGGANILSFEALAATEMDPPFNGIKAIDKNPATAWGIEPAEDGTGIAGSSYVIKLTEEQTITRVGILNPLQTELGRPTGVVWGSAGFDGNAQQGPLVTQELPDESGVFYVPFDVTTDQISLSLTGVHDDAPNAGVAEILIEVAEVSPDAG